MKNKIFFFQWGLALSLGSACISIGAMFFLLVFCYCMSEGSGIGNIIPLIAFIVLIVLDYWVWSKGIKILFHNEYLPKSKETCLIIAFSSFVTNVLVSYLLVHEQYTQVLFFGVQTLVLVIFMVILGRQYFRENVV